MLFVGRRAGFKVNVTPTVTNVPPGQDQETYISWHYDDIICGKKIVLIEGSLEVKLPTIWTDEKQSREEAERRERLEERRVEEKESEERRCRCTKR